MVTRRNDESRKMLDSNATYEMIPVENLKIDAYQRILNTVFGKEIANTFDMNKVGVITVCLRNGIYNVADGQHRVYAARIAKVPVLMCQVLHGLTYEEEAILFKELNKRRKGILVFDYFNADLEAKEPEALNIRDTVKRNGIEISRGTGHNKIQAITTLKNIYKKYGLMHLDKTLLFIHETWEGIGESYSRNNIMGVSDFINLYDEELSLDIFVRQFRRVDPIKIAREADNDSSNISKTVKMSNIMFRYYNHKLRSNRLPNKYNGF